MKENTVSDGNFNVDDDWKNRAEAEKQAALQASEEPGEEQMDIPEASFPLLVSTLATQAMSALGLLPGGEQTMIHKPLARHMIDLLAVLEEKTSGNLEESEKTMLEQVLGQLRTAYLQTPDESAPAKDSNDGPSIIMP